MTHTQIVIFGTGEQAIFLITAEADNIFMGKKQRRRMKKIQLSIILLYVQI